MANEIGFGRYQPGTSLLYRLDPRTKLASLVLIIVSLFSAADFLALAFMTLVVAAIWLSLRLPLRLVLKTIIPLFVLSLFPLLFNLFFIHEGTTLVQWGFIQITDGGIYQGCFMALRLFLMFAVAIALITCTRPLDMAKAFGRLLAPLERLHVPAYELSLMFGIALRFIPDIGISFNAVRKAQQARGAVFDSGGPIRRLRAFLPCLVPLFTQVFRHAEELALAMESRCYHGGSAHSSYRESHFRRRDLMALIVCAAIMALVIGLRFFI
jgi:energy-coupling factor transport system permease protein